MVVELTPEQALQQWNRRAKEREAALLAKLELKAAKFRARMRARAPKFWRELDEEERREREWEEREERLQTKKLRRVDPIVWNELASWARSHGWTIWQFIDYCFQEHVLREEGEERIEGRERGQFAEREARLALREAALAQRESDLAARERGLVCQGRELASQGRELASRERAILRQERRLEGIGAHSHRHRHGPHLHPHAGAATP